MADALTVTIDGTDRSNHVKTDVSRRTVKVSLALGSQWSATVPVFDADLTLDPDDWYRADIDEPLLITHTDAGTVFNGQITGVQEGPLDVDSDRGVLQMLTARAATPIMEQIQDITVTYPSGQTRKQVLTALVTDYLADFGITLDPTITDGDVLPKLAYDGVTPATILTQIQTITAEVWRLTPDLVLEMFAIGAKVAPFSLDGTNAGSVRVNTTRGQYLNRARLKAGPTAQLVKDDVVIADGLASSWVMRYTPVSDGAGFIVSRGVVHEDDGITPFDATLSEPGGGGTYEFDPVTNTLTRTTGVPAAGIVITLTSTVQFPITVVAEDAADIALHGLWSRTFADANVTDIDTADEVVAGLLATGLTQPREVTLMTTEGFVLPGTTIPLSFPKRQISGDYLVTKVEVADFEADLLEYTYTLQSGGRAQGTFTDALRSKLGAGGSHSSRSSPIYLGGASTISVTNPTTKKPIPNAVPYVAPVSFTGRLRVKLRARDAGVGFKAIISDGTTDIETSLITSTTFTPTTVLVAIVAGQTYTVHLENDAAGDGFCEYASLEVAA